MKKLQKLTLQQLDSSDIQSLRSNDLNALKGGQIYGGTLNTVTVTPSGNTDDGVDPEFDEA